MNFSKRACPICDHATSRLLFRQSFSAMSAGSMLQGYDVVVCASAGVRMPTISRRRRSLRPITATCPSMSMMQRRGKNRNTTSRYNAVAAIISQIASSRDIRILDVGCSTGRLLDVLKRQGYHHAVGLDPSPVCRSQCQATL